MLRRLPQVSCRRHGADCCLPRKTAGDRGGSLRDNGSWCRHGRVRMLEDLPIALSQRQALFEALAKIAEGGEGEGTIVTCPRRQRRGAERVVSPRAGPKKQTYGVAARRLDDGVRFAVTALRGA